MATGTYYVVARRLKATLFARADEVIE